MTVLKKNQKILLWLLIITILSVGYLIEEKENVKIVKHTKCKQQKNRLGNKKSKQP